MECSRCGEVKAEGQVRTVWRRVPKGEKRRFLAAVAGVMGGSLGWALARETGALTGMFLAGCVGEIGGLMRYKDGVSTDAVEGAGR